MINFITVTPWEYRAMPDGYSREYFELSCENLRETARSYLLREAYTGDDEAHIGVLKSDPIFEELISKYHGSEIDPSSLRLSDKGFALECDSYITSAADINSHLIAGLCVLEAARRGKKIFMDKSLFDEITLKFLAERGELYTIYVCEFTDWGLYDTFKECAERIAFDGKKFSKGEIADHILRSNRTKVIPKYIDRAKEVFEKFISKEERYHCFFDAVISLSAEEFCSKAREELQSDDEHSGMEGYRIYVHTQALRKESLAKYPIVLAAREYSDGSSECEHISLVKYPTLYEQADGMRQDAEEHGCSKAVYALFDCEILDGFYNDVFDDVDLYVEVNADRRELHLYDGKNVFGKKAFFDIYNESTRYISKW